MGRAPENLMALPNRLYNTWRSRTSSANTCSGISGETNKRRSTPLLAATGSSEVQSPSARSRIESGASSNSSRPASILEKSRISSIRLNSTPADSRTVRSEEHTSELQSLMSTSYAVFCLKKKNHYHSLQLCHNIHK